MADKDKKKPLPKHIQEFYDRDSKVRKLLNTTESVHSEAYQKGLEAIKDAKTREVDYEQLKDVKKQDALLEKMMDHYISNAVKALNLKEKPKDEFEQEIILKKYIGITRGELRSYIRKAKSDYTLKHHEQIRDQLVKRQTNELMPLRHEHFEESHIEDILAHTGVKDYVAKDRVSIAHAASLLDIYKQKGDISLSDLKQLADTSEEKGGWDNDVYLTDKAKDGIKKLKEKHKESR